ncbi:drug/metabolite transporter (DMT)-like permease [Brevibacillus fulvus]|uniref:Drug/metabolite transporter (DMT)-like permease n=2 Tax=Brevibacillus fulvus TaxID=1125967 RepID=A0A939BQK7_9BACL|nr:DMT family transporter [Brevibacillus fulvus]MBM7591735.1 drug/metabolite transporter (DMT)-like permease [Brevibacillus fulvus]
MASSRTRSALLLAFLVVMWGVNWPLSKFALTYTPPILFAGIRTLLGGLILLVVALPKYKQLRFKESWHIYVISAVLNIILFYGLQTIGLNYLPAGLFSSIVFLQPVLLGLMAWLWLGESMFALKALGFVLGFAGVATISAGGLTGNISLTGILLALGCAISWAAGTFYVKKTGNRVDSIWLVTSQLLIGGLFMMGVGSEVESWTNIDWNLTFLSTLLFISIFVIALGWLVFFFLVGSGEAGKVASYTFLIPLIAILCSVLFMHEQITVNLIAGLVLVVISILLVNANPQALLAKKTGKSA